MRIFVISFELATTWGNYELNCNSQAFYSDSGGWRLNRLIAASISRSQFRRQLGSHQFRRDSMDKIPRDDDDFEYIFVASFVHKKTGKRIFASSYGKKAFRIRIKKKSKKDN